MARDAWLLPGRVMVLDTETTGIPWRDPWAEIIELAAVVVSPRGKLVGAYSTLVQPQEMGQCIDAALEVNGITRRMLRKAPEPSEVRETFSAFQQRMQAAVSTSYNVAFEKEMCSRFRVTVTWGDCLMRLARATMRESGMTGRFRFRLVDAAEFYGVPLPDEGQRHRAYDDAKLAARVLVANQKLDQRNQERKRQGAEKRRVEFDDGV